ncbi:hypothetical protein TVAG_115050 [Trichomonas vaginalis G3]|uniref:Uncharacterized protein n=1 Tax=Trichomonas vaginalis (strain ATCC PRA-98 / G3) TaxID=412133 RepID=A2G6K3_TRIV3|nr:hypothetical protein TVAG_115050 [Trichomonas vaginalis G3]|eukprot:XP_001300143.1 hypothetical protein [Trichomonas vaginalis G3]
MSKLLERCLKKNNIDFISCKGLYTLLNDMKDPVVSMVMLGMVALRASVHHLAVLTLYETVNVYFTTQTTTLT